MKITKFCTERKFPAVWFVTSMRVFICTYYRHIFCRVVIVALVYLAARTVKRLYRYFAGRIFREFREIAFICEINFVICTSSTQSGAAQECSQCTVHSRVVCRRKPFIQLNTKCRDWLTN